MRLLLLGVGGMAGAAGGALDSVASVTGAWSLSRDLKSSFAGGTRYTKSGSAIITLEDQGGSNRDFTDGGVTARRPVETTAGPNSKLCADFDGTVTNYLDTFSDTSNFIGNASGALVISCIIDAVTLNNGLVYQNHPVFADGPQFVGIYAKNVSGTTPTVFSFNWDGNADSPTGITFSTGTAYVFMWRHHGGTLYVSVNGGAENSVASGNTSTMTSDLRLAPSTNMKCFEAFTTSDGSQTAALAAAIADMKTWIGA